MKLLPILAIIGLILLLRRPIINKVKQLSKKERIRYSLYAVAIIFLLLAATGRVHWLGAIIAATIPFIRNLLPWVIRLAPWIVQQVQTKQSQQTGHNTSGPASHVKTQTLSMNLDHDTGEIQGEVLQGPFTGKMLSQLSLSQCLALLNWLNQNDTESCPLLETYLSHTYSEEQWHQAYQEQFKAHQYQSSAYSSSAMTREEALAILGLSEPVEKAKIIKAHRRLMSKYHPDKGGNDYLASKINQAKDMLI